MNQKTTHPMPTLDERIKKRDRKIADAETASRSTVKSLQMAAYIAVVEWALSSLDTDDGKKIKYTSANLASVAGLYRVLNDWQAKYQGTLIGKILEWSGRIFGANADYFEPMSPADGIADKARFLVMQRWGYNIRTKKIIPGGYFEFVFDNNRIARRVASLVNQAILQGMTLSEFQRMFRNVFVIGGMLERHWRTNSFDLFMRIDRATNLVYADELGLQYAIYSGTLEEDSRPKCIKSVNKVFSRTEIAGWKDEDFQGKPKVGYDPFLDCGGYNCRHHWSWISDTLAQKLRE